VLKPGCDGHETEAGESARVQRSLHHHDFKRVDALQLQVLYPMFRPDSFQNFLPKKRIKATGNVLPRVNGFTRRLCIGGQQDVSTFEPLYFDFCRPIYHSLGAPAKGP
jgi:hypothetical protein